MRAKFSGITLGFISIFIVLTMLLLMWTYSQHRGLSMLGFVLSENKEALMLHRLVHAMHNRSISLYRMVVTESPAQVDEHLAEFMQLTDEFMRVSTAVLEADFSEDEKRHWDEAIPMVQEAQQLTQQAVALISARQMERARILLDKKIIPIQGRIVEQLNALIRLQMGEVDEVFEDFQHTSYKAYAFVTSLFVILAGIAVLIQITLRKKYKAEADLIQQGERIRALYELSSLSSSSTDEQILETLEFGRALLEVEMAKISRIDPVAGLNELTHIVGSAEVKRLVAKTRPLSQTLCSVAYETERPLMLADVANSAYKLHAGYLLSNFRTYAAVPIWVKGAKYGTVAFADRRAHKGDFTATDLDLMQLIARWIGVNLEREMAQRIELEKKEAIAASEAKSHFLANMSHEIRTPLNAIIGFTEAAMYGQTTKEELDKALRTINHSSHHLLDLLNNILDISKVEAGAMDVESVSCSVFDIIADVELLVRSKIVEKGLGYHLDYRFPLPGYINTDPVKLKQILINLCSNAVKFTEQGQITFEMSCDVPNKRLYFALIDTGIGLSQEQQGKIFRPFTQGDASTTRRYGGTGLGLSLSRELVALLGGELSVRSAPNMGSRFEFYIQLADLDEGDLIYSLQEVPQRSEYPHEYGDSAGLSGHVLVVDDTLDNQGLMVLLLGKFGIRASVANHGREAVDMVNAAPHDYDLIMMDMHMPVMDGYTAVELLRKQGHNMPIVAVTADALASHRERCFAVGCTAFLTKPVKRDSLVNILTKYLRDGPGVREQDPAIESNLHEEGLEFGPVIRGFVEKLPQKIADLDAAIQSENNKEVAAQLHMLKGVAANMGYPQFADVMEEMEEIVARGEPLNAADWVPVMEALYRRMERGLAGQGAGVP